MSIAAARSLDPGRVSDTSGGWRPGINQWDHDACYKPYAIYDGRRWLLWYNGRHGNVEQIGLAIHEGEDLSF